MHSKYLAKPLKIYIKLYAKPALNNNNAINRVETKFFENTSIFSFLVMYTFAVLKTRKSSKETRNPSRIQPLDFDFLGDFLKYLKKQIDMFVIVNTAQKMKISIKVTFT